MSVSPDEMALTEGYEAMMVEKAMVEEFEAFSQMRIYGILCQMAKDDEDEAIERLIKHADDPAIANVQRGVIQRCRYFAQWAQSLGDALTESTIDVEPPE
jgi:hypothetical protein